MESRLTSMIQTGRCCPKGLKFGLKPSGEVLCYCCY
jgi:hypothetical protein